VIYILRVSDSVFCGYPKSKISERHHQHGQDTWLVHTINKLVNDDKVAFNALFIHFAEIRFTYVDETIAEFEY